MELTVPAVTVPPVVADYFNDRFAPGYSPGYEPIALSLFIRGQWERLPLSQARRITADWAAGAMAAGATAVLVAHDGRTADFQLAELV